MEGFQESKFILVSGLPLAGKSTLCTYLERTYGFIHIALGELIRENVTYKQTIEEHIKSGQLIPSKISFDILQRELIKNHGKIILIDGFPRNEENLSLWNQHIGIQPFCVLLLEVEVDVIMARLSDRKHENRLDDNDILLKSRINSFYKETMPVLEYYKQNNLLYTVSNKRDDIISDVIRVLDVIKLI